MNNIFFILFILLFVSLTFAGEKESANLKVMPMGCYVEEKNTFNDRAKVYLKEAEGVMVMYFDELNLNMYPLKIVNSNF